MSKHRDDADVAAQEQANEEASAHETSGRRRFLLTGMASAVSAVAGVGAGYAYAREVDQYAMLVADNPPGRRDFHSRRRAIQKRHNQQTQEIVTGLKAKYEQAVFGKARVWELIEKLAFCIDPTDVSLYCTNQFIHVQQILEGMERDGIADQTLLLTALLHDTGKVLLLTDELPENIVCGIESVETAPDGVGLDNVMYQFGHGEMIYSRLKDQVPDHVAWLLRYHAIGIARSERYMNERDRAYAEKYLVPFRRYDLDKSSTRLPQLDLKKYRALIEDTFPHPILF